MTAAAVMPWLKPLIEAFAPILEVLARVIIEQLEKPTPAAKGGGSGPASDLDRLDGP